MRRSVVTESWEEMKEKLKEKYLLEYYRNCLLDQLHNFRQGDILVQDYIAKFEDLTLHCDEREQSSHTVTRFVWGLRSKIRRVMITSPYDLDIVEETFDVALKIDLTFKRLVNVKVRYSKCEGYGHYDHQCPLKSQHVSIVSSDDVDNSKVVEDIHIPSKITNIIETISISSDTSILDEGHAS